MAMNQKVKIQMRTERKPPTSRNDSLGVLVPSLRMETEGKPPTSHNGSLGVVVVGGGLVISVPVT